MNRKTLFSASIFLTFLVFLSAGLALALVLQPAWAAPATVITVTGTADVRANDGV